ncbi:glycosyltransferase family A protein [Nostoc sp. NIES-2111]
MYASTPWTVAVVIPAYNAEATIAETLASVGRQTHTSLEILVVDDGSTDATAAIVEAALRRDSRIRLLRQPNRGVASARNEGICATRASLIAPCDADDVWHVTKIEKQLEALQAAPPGTGLVYTWSASIDGNSRIVGLDFHADHEGEVVRQLALGNFLGNASCALFTLEAFMSAGGYDTRLREGGAEGCEDWRLYLAIASRHSFACVREYLTGYRVTDGNMSSRAAKMLMAHRVTADMIAADDPGLRPLLDESYAHALYGFYVRALRASDLRQAMRLLRELYGIDPQKAVAAALVAPRTIAANGLGLSARQALRSRLGRAGQQEPALGSVFGKA